MDNKKRLRYLVIFIGFIIILTTTLTLVYIKKYQNNDNITNIDKSNGDNIKIKIINFEVNYVNEYWALSLYVENLTNDYYDAGSNYNLIIYGEDNSIIKKYNHFTFGYFGAKEKMKYQFRDVYTGVKIGRVEIQKADNEK